MAGPAGAGAGPGAGISPMSGPGEAGAGPANEAGSAALQFGTLAAKTATLVGSSSPGSQHDGKSVGFCRVCPVLLACTQSHSPAAVWNLVACARC